MSMIIAKTNWTELFLLYMIIALFRFFVKWFYIISSLMAPVSVFLFLVTMATSLQNASGTEWLPNRIPDTLGLLSQTPKPEEMSVLGRSDLDPTIKEETKSHGYMIINSKTSEITYFDAGGEEITEVIARSDLPENAAQSEIYSAPTDKADIRLPNSMRPLHYTIKIQPYVNGNMSIHGFMEVDIEVLKNSTEISIHADGIECSYDTVKLTPLDEVNFPLNITHFTMDLDRQFLSAHLETPVIENVKYRYSMYYTTELGHHPQGFFSFKYSDANGAERRSAATAFQPTYARRAFPCFDEPALKATFNISLARQTNMTAISNMPLRSTKRMIGTRGWVWDNFEVSPPMSTYLVAFVISDLKSLKTTLRDNIPIQVWARKEVLHEAKYALDITSSVCKFFEEYFNISYPLPKLDVIALPSSNMMAFEAWGTIIGYSERSFLYSNASIPASKYQIGTVLAHEVAHQWFGNLVTPLWWTDLWLNEGFASYLENVALANVKPEWGVEEHQVMKDIHSVLRKDSLVSSHPISIPVYHPDEITEIFDRISYEKGSSLIRMMSHFLTEKTFKRGITNFLNRHKFSGANQDNLWEVLTEVGHEDGTLPVPLTVKEIMDSWTLQMGYPVINVARSIDGTYAVLDQEWFLLTRNISDEEAPERKWWIPLTFTSQENPNFNDTQPLLWVENSTTHTIITNLPTKDQWVIFNLQQTGFYRVNYDDNNWNLISKQLRENHEIIPVINRAQILDDALNLALTGKLSYDKALDVTQYLKKETQLAVWEAVFGNIEYMNSMLVNTAAYGGFQEYILSLLSPLYEHLGLENHPGEPFMAHVMRPEVIKWACKLGHRQCVRLAKDLYKNWTDSPKEVNIIPENMRRLVYCTAIAHGGRDEWEFAWKQYGQVESNFQKDDLIIGMTCSRESWVKQRYLYMAFTPGVALRNHDTYQIYNGFASKPYDHDTAWDFLRQEYNIVPTLFGINEDVIRSFVESTTKYFNTNNELNELQAFLLDHEDNVLVKNPVEKAIEQTQENIAWLNRNYQVISLWLEIRGYSTSLKL